MKRICQRLQSVLAESGPAALRTDEAAQQHLEDCAQCFEMLESFAELDRAFEAMPTLDAPDELVERLLRRDELRQASEVPTTPHRRSWARSFGGATRFGRGVRLLLGPGQPRLKAAVALIGLAVISVPTYLSFQRSAQETEPQIIAVEVVSKPGDRERDNELGDRELGGDGGPDDDREPDGEEAARRLQRATEARRQLAARQGGREANAVRQQLEALAYLAEEESSEVVRKLDVFTKSGTNEQKGSIDLSRDARLQRPLPEAPRTPVPDPAEPEPQPAAEEPYLGAGFTGGYVAKDLDAVEIIVRDELAQDPASREDASIRDKVAFRGRVQGLSAEYGASVGGKLEAENQRAAEAAPADVVAVAEAPPAPVADIVASRELARRFLAERERLAGVSFQPAEGYWSNTYVPGDPVLRHLQGRLADRDRAMLQAASVAPLVLHDAARRTTQPFDPPKEAALGLALQADRRGVAGESRVLMQVGLVGSQRLGGRRPAMNVGLVLDLRQPVTTDDALSLQALVAAFSAARGLGDRFRLIVAGPGGGEILAPDALRHGPVTVAMQRLLGDAAALQEPAVSLVDAMRLAIERVGQSDDPSEPLGSSAVILATSRDLGDDVAALIELAHTSAVAGMPVSVVGVGDRVALADLDRLALAGQGNRRLMGQPQEAPAVVDRELAAIARVVARAVRLRIGLAPGVRLIDIVGARRYDEAAADQVRRAERSIDQRLARNLGLEADRGDDEPGIQIVLPTFYAQDRHVILLDLAVSGPGPVADVTIRFKDLVQLENGVARARLDLPRGEATRGPLERNVLKNLLAHQLRGVLERAGQLAAAPSPKLAEPELSAHLRLLEGLGHELPGFDQDRDLDRDITMLTEFCQLLTSEVVQEEPLARLLLAESMTYAGLLKVLPLPLPRNGSR